MRLLKKTVTSQRWKVSVYYKKGRSVPTVVFPMVVLTGKNFVRVELR